MSVLQINDNDIIDPQTMTWDLYDLDSEDGVGPFAYSGICNPFPSSKVTELLF